MGHHGQQCGCRWVGPGGAGVDMGRTRDSGSGEDPEGLGAWEGCWDRHRWGQRDSAAGFTPSLRRHSRPLSGASGAGAGPAGRGRGALLCPQQRRDLRVPLRGAGPLPPAARRRGLSGGDPRGGAGQVRRGGVRAGHRPHLPLRGEAARLCVQQDQRWALHIQPWHLATHPGTSRGAGLGQAEGLCTLLNPVPRPRSCAPPPSRRRSSQPWHRMGSSTPWSYRVRPCAGCTGGLACTAALMLEAVTVALSPQASGWTLGSQRTSLRACACTCRHCGLSTPRSCTRGPVS